MRLVLVRHGETPSNVLGLLDTGSPGPGLTDLGHRQAAQVSVALAGEEVEAVFVSTLIRTHQTAAPLAEAGGHEVVVREGLREIQAGDLEMRGDEQAVVRFHETFRAWAHGDLGVRMPGAERGADVLARYDRVIDEVATTTSRTAVIVSHGAVIRLWAAARGANLDPAFAVSRRLANTGAVVIEGDPSAGWRVRSWEGEPVA